VVRQKPAKLPFPSSNLGATFRTISMLVLIATPIGNLKDLSERARAALCSCDFLCCEDTRHTGLLFQALQLTPPRLLSLHKFNEAHREDEVISLLRSGMTVGLVSDAGTPAIADPGAALVARCHREGIPVTALPGPCAFATAYALSGATCSRMQFLGFLPKGDREREGVLAEMAQYDGASAVYESPNRLLETVSCAAALEGSWEVVLVRELTKVYEEVVRLPAKELASRLSTRTVKGECVLVFLPCPKIGRPSDEQLLCEIRTVQKTGACSLKEAIEVVAQQYRLSRRDLYQLCIGN
jgi:16S rRNA (cytidine1402-2'-O)-methyltransferase